MNYDKYYWKMINKYRIIKKLRIHNIPKIKGLIYKFYCKLANRENLESYEGINNNIDEGIIVSLTSFPERIDNVAITILSIMRQTIRPDIYLWLSKEQFPQGIDLLPENLKELLKYRLHIEFCDDIKPHKKYYYSMKNNPNKIIITVDDDVLYPSNVIEELIRLHKKYPKCIICTRGHLITIKDKNINSYKEWIDNPDIDDEPNMYICPTGVGGVLYPPNSLDKEVFNKVDITNLCLNADDLWLKTMSLKHNTNIVKSQKFPYCFLTVGDSQKVSLSSSNVSENRNDEQMRNILSKYSGIYEKLIK